MTHNFTKQELKSPDVILDRLNHLVDWTKRNSSPIAIVLGVFVVGSSLWSAVQYFSDKKEMAAQEKYFPLEKSYVEQKQKFDEAELKSKEANKPSAAKDKSKESATAKPESKKATGDLQQDYGPLVQDFKVFVSENSNTQAAKMAVLNLSEVYVKYNKIDEALEAIKLVDSSLSPKELLSALVLSQKATLLANKNNCQDAVVIWANLAKNQQLKYLHSEFNLRMGLCYEAMGDKQKATEMLSEASKKSGTPGGGSESGVSQEAEKYLRLLKLQAKGS